MWKTDVCAQRQQPSQSSREGQLKVTTSTYKRHATCYHHLYYYVSGDLVFVISQSYPFQNEQKLAIYPAEASILVLAQKERQCWHQRCYNRRYLVRTLLLPDFERKMQLPILDQCWAFSTIKGMKFVIGPIDGVVVVQKIIIPHI